MNKLEQAARQAFETWWESEGQEFLFALNTTTDDDIKLVAEIAWKNGAYCAEQAEQAPVAWGYFDADGSFMDALDRQHGSYQTPLYAAPVRTKDLTDDEIMKINVDTASIVPTCDRQFHFARAVIAAFKEKNK